MQIFMDREYVSFFKALSSETRLDIISLLVSGEKSIKEIAEALNLSSPIIVRHIRILEDENIISTHTVNINGSIYKKCVLLNTYYEILSQWDQDTVDSKESTFVTELEIGHFTDIEVQAPCGMLSEEDLIEDIDTPSQMFSTKRINAKLIWFTDGFIEYKFPNHITKRQMEKIIISGEFASEHPGYNDDWPSSINVYLNDINICKFTVPGDFGSSKGLLTPKWWENNQYGILVTIKIDMNGTYVNGEQKSTFSINDLDLKCTNWKLKFATNRPDSKGCGFSIFGDTYGNYKQNLILKQIYNNYN